MADLKRRKSRVYFAKLEINNRKGLAIPLSWAADKNGMPTSNPKEAMHDGGLLPLGGSEESSGYKVSHKLFRNACSTFDI
jgi:LDH2 family malate/lactate/ureidoglycolate dehydrogenase